MFEDRLAQVLAGATTGAVAGGGRTGPALERPLGVTIEMDRLEHRRPVEGGSAGAVPPAGPVPPSADLVHDLPDTLDALARGRITLPVARAIAEETSHLQAGLRRAVEARVLGKAADRTPAQTRRAVRSAILQIEPAAARVREIRAWRLEQPSPGLFVWISPTGRIYAVRPPDPPEPP